MPLDRDDRSRAPHGVQPSAVEEAIAWSVRLGSGDVTDDDRLAFERWRRLDTTHEHAWCSVQEVEDAFAPLAGAQREVAVRALDAANPLRSARRRRVIGAGLATVGVLAIGRFAWQSFSSQQDFISSPQGRNRFALDDGSMLHLNVGTAIAVRFTPFERAIHLGRGQILIETGADQGRPLGHRPFVVTTPEARLEALGTRFDVRVMDAGTQVAVTSGRVAIRTLLGDETAIARPRDQFVVTHVIQRAIDSGLDPSAWSGGNLIARDVRLDAFVVELSRYASHPLVCAPEVASLRVSGVFQLDGPDATTRIAQVVARTLGIVATAERSDRVVLKRH